MIVLLAVAIATGIGAAMILMPYGVLIALMVSPLVASLSAVLAGCLMAWRAARYDRSQQDLESQTRIMVAALRKAVQRTGRTSPAPKVSQRRRGS